MIGTIVNTCCIVTGSIVGSLLKKGLDEKYTKALFNAMGLVSLALGASTFASNMPKSEMPVLFILSLAIGGVVGTALDLVTSTVLQRRSRPPAPLGILCCIDHSQEWVRPADSKQHGTIDIAIAAEHICLAAAEQGLGSCWICNFDVDKASGLFDLPDNLEPAVLIPIGNSATESIREKSRKDLSEIVETR